MSVDLELFKATKASVGAATHLTDADQGAVEVLYTLAMKIDLMDEYLEVLVDDARQHDLRPPSQDNVSIPTYLKYCESLGLTPAGRAKLEEAKGGRDAGKLTLLKGQRPTG